MTTDPAEVLDSGDVDAIIIASPTPTHVDLISAAIDADIPVLCEKPIDLDIARVDALREKARTASVPVILGFNRRFDPHFAELHRRVTRGDIGPLEQLTITSRDPEPAPAAYIAVSGGIFRDMTIHDFDMTRFFVPDIVEVTARGAQQFSTVIAEAGDYDAVVVTLRGARRRADHHHQLAALRLRLRPADRGLRQLLDSSRSATSDRPWCAPTAPNPSKACAPYHTFFLERYAEAYRLELAAFVEAIHGRPSTSPGFEDGRAALILADAAVRSAAEGVSVDVDVERMSTPALVATCWTSAGNVAPLDDPEVSPFAAIDRVRAVASTGWAGIGFAQGDLQVVRETIGFPALRAEIEAAGLRHVEVELASGWWRRRPRLARNLGAAARSGPRDSRLRSSRSGPQFGSPVDDITPFVEPLRRIADEAAAIGTRVAIEPLPFGLIGSMPQGADLIRAAGHPSAGLVVDFWHVFRADTTLPELVRAVSTRTWSSASSSAMPSRKPSAPCSRTPVTAAPSSATAPKMSSASSAPCARWASTARGASRSCRPSTANGPSSRR